MFDYINAHKKEVIARKILVGRSDGQKEIIDLVLSDGGVTGNWWILIKSSRKKKNFVKVTQDNIRRALRAYGNLLGPVSTHEVEHKYFRRIKTGILSKRDHFIKFQKLLIKHYGK